VRSLYALLQRGRDPVHGVADAFDSQALVCRTKSLSVLLYAAPSHLCALLQRGPFDAVHGVAPRVHGLLEGVTTLEYLQAPHTRFISQKQKLVCRTKSYAYSCMRHQVIMRTLACGTKSYAYSCMRHQVIGVPYYPIRWRHHPRVSAGAAHRFKYWSRSCIPHQVICVHFYAAPSHRVRCCRPHQVTSHLMADRSAAVVCWRKQTIYPDEWRHFVERVSEEYADEVGLR
jgi:hypothetical protein